MSTTGNGDGNGDRTAWASWKNWERHLTAGLIAVVAFVAYQTYDTADRTSDSVLKLTTKFDEFQKNLTDWKSELAKYQTERQANTQRQIDDVKRRLDVMEDAERARQRAR